MRRLRLKLLKEVTLKGHPYTDDALKSEKLEAGETGKVSV